MHEPIDSYISTSYSFLSSSTFIIATTQGRPSSKVRRMHTSPCVIPSIRGILATTVPCKCTCLFQNRDLNLNVTSRFSSTSSTHFISRQPLQNNPCVFDVLLNYFRCVLCQQQQHAQLPRWSLYLAELLVVVGLRVCLLSLRISRRNSLPNVVLIFLKLRPVLHE